MPFSLLSKRMGRRGRSLPGCEGVSYFTFPYTGKEQMPKIDFPGAARYSDKEGMGWNEGKRLAFVRLALAAGRDNGLLPWGSTR